MLCNSSLCARTSRAGRERSLWTPTPRPQVYEREVSSAWWVLSAIAARVVRSGAGPQLEALGRALRDADATVRGMLASSGAEVSGSGGGELDAGADRGLLAGIRWQADEWRAAGHAAARAIRAGVDACGRCA